MSELESLAFHIKSREAGLLDGHAGLLATVSTAQPYLDMLFEDIDKYGELDRYRSCIDSLSELTVEELDILAEANQEYWGTRQFLTVAQNHVTLTNEMLENSEPFSVNNTPDSEQGIAIYKKCMDICDSGFPALLNMKCVVEGGDPRDRDYISMNFGAVRNSLRNHESFSPLVDAIDTDLRNAIAHGDIWVDPVENTIETNNPDESYSLNEFDEAVSVVIPLARFVATFPTVVRSRWAAEKSGFSEYARDHLDTS
jgi:hypothetical protein